MKLTRELPNELETRLKKSVFVGRLATDDELALTFIDDAVIFQDEHHDFLLFHMKCLSAIPPELSQYFFYQNNIFRGSTRSPSNIAKIRSQLVPGYDKLVPEVRRQRLKESLRDKLILFTLTFSGTIVYADMLKIEKTDVLLDDYWVMPSPTLGLDEKKEDFEERMLSRRPIVLGHYPNVLPDPRYIYCGGYLYANVKLSKSGNPMTYYVGNPAEVKRMRVSASFYEQVQSRYDDSIYVLPASCLPALAEEMSRSGISLEQAAQQVEPVPAEEPASAAELLTNEAAAAAQTSAAVLEKSALGDAGELAFIARLEENARLRGLYFDRQDIINFHTSLKTNLLTIVGGMSGTGKSQLALLYGETLGLNFGRELKLVPVSPSFHEPNDILGYYNPATGAFHESDIGLVSLLREAERNPDLLYMVIFDEMNLAQVEHWFSPFISLLELDVPKRRLSLFHAAGGSANGYEPQIGIGDNVLFVGTVNFDETTKGFSDRLLDRANIITPRKLTFKEVRELQTAQQPNDIVRSAIGRGVFREQWLTPGTGGLTGLSEGEVELFDQIHDRLQAADSQRGISHRVIRAVVHYLENLPRTAEGGAVISRDQALDIQIKQRVLSKISGLESAIGTLVGSYDGEDYQGGSLADVLQSAEAQRLSTFKLSLDLLKKKAKELMVHGFAN